MAVKFRQPDGSVDRPPRPDLAAVPDRRPRGVRPADRGRREAVAAPAVPGPAPGRGAARPWPAPGPRRSRSPTPSPRSPSTRSTPTAGWPRTAPAPGSATSSGRPRRRRTGWRRRSRAGTGCRGDAARLARGPVTHEVWVQVAGEGHDPHSATSVWDGCRELLAGRIVVTAEAAGPRGRPDERVARRSSTRPASSTASSSPTTRSCATGRRPTRSRCPGGSPRPSRVKTLVIGTGGREHALARALSRDPGVTEVHVAPGNPGIAAVATLHDVDPLDGAAVAAWPCRSGSTWSSSGPRRRWSRASPTRSRSAASRCSGRPGRPRSSRGRRRSPRTSWPRPASRPHARSSARRRRRRPPRSTSSGAPYVVKDDGLAAGKGVVVTEDREAALAHAARLRRGW